MGIVGEMIDESVSGALDNPDLEDEADEEAQRVIDEVLGGRFLSLSIQIYLFIYFLDKIRQLPSAIPDEQAAESEPEVETNFAARLQALKEWVQTVILNDSIDWIKTGSFKKQK